ncbi:hypothetical protein [Pengzhenrongella frigida]|uniref:DUF4439 domain-containing protein n=1 Tax=Pengzhenrongella frigida TaxID=1259133 RepID=A0A4Q5MV02_9MICO|nr:hypothetical protein [Cellulomonas sp. HLT2-17]RYV49330.1 hypothetical protein EUA98_19370 [Cellulomonas sp. HLT2-17]
MTVRFSAGRRGAPVLLALGALVVGLSGCSGQPGAAAVVDGETISVAELQDATTDLTPYLENVTQSNVLMVLVAAPVFDRAASAAGVGVSTQEAEALLDQAAQAAEEAGTAPARTTGFSAAAIEVARFTLLQQNIQGLPDGAEVTAQVSEELASLDAEINPRYGEADLATGSITPATYPWLVAAPAVG